MVISAIYNGTYNICSETESQEMMHFLYGLVHSVSQDSCAYGSSKMITPVS